MTALFFKSLQCIKGDRKSVMVSTSFLDTLDRVKQELVDIFGKAGDYDSAKVITGMSHEQLIYVIGVGFSTNALHRSIDEAVKVGKYARRDN